MMKKRRIEFGVCFRFRHLMELTVKDSYPLSRIKESLPCMGQAKCFVSLHLPSDFLQITLKSKY